MKKNFLRLTFFILVLAWFTGLSNALYLPIGKSSFVSLILKPFYSPVCHQAPGKTFTFESGKFLVCARCTGIYFGALIMSAASLLFKKIRAVFILPALILMAFDVFSTTLGLYSYSKTFAFITGLISGLTLFPYILNIIENSFLNETE